MLQARYVFIQMFTYHVRAAAGGGVKMPGVGRDRPFLELLNLHLQATRVRLKATTPVPRKTGGVVGPIPAHPPPRVVQNVGFPWTVVAQSMEQPCVFIVFLRRRHTGLRGSSRGDSGRGLCPVCVVAAVLANWSVRICGCPED